MSIPVIHDQDGHVDDLLTCLLLWLAPEIDLQAVGITNGDCYVEQAFQSMLKIATFLDLEGVEISLSTEEMPNRFPETWRRESFIVTELPLFCANDLKKPYEQGRPRKSAIAFADCLNHSKASLTLVTSGPLTTVAEVLKQDPKLSSKVKEIVLVAGALCVPGNVEADGLDGSAEWNIYADPNAFKFVLDSKIPIKLIPLDTSKQVPVSAQFLDKLNAQAQTYAASRLAVSLWSIVKSFQTHFCDMLAAAALIQPSLLQFENRRIDVNLSGKSMGKISSPLFSGRKIQVAIAVNQDGFEDLVLSVLRLR